MRDTDSQTSPHDMAPVDNAVESFVDRVTCGEAIDPEQYAAGMPENIRTAVLRRCRRFLEFNDLVGDQGWTEDELETAGQRMFGDYVIEGELGRGGMGIVYLARQSSLKRRVALKVMASGLTLSRRHVERFRREASQAAQLQHPHIVPVHSFFEVDGTFALAMDYIAGRNLGEVLEDLRLANDPAQRPIEGSLGIQPDKGYVAECAMLVAQIASALEAAHDTGIAHRDLKPRNIMIDEQRRARLLDFGLAKSTDQHSISASGEMTGTVHYMSPEQTLARRMPQDHRTDVWSLGVILYELLTLHRPFEEKNLQQIVYAICFKEPVAIQKHNPRVPRDLATICQKAMEKDPVKRYQTAGELEADLQRFLSWEPIQARPSGPLLRLAKWMQRHRREGIVAGVVLTLALGVGITSVVQTAMDHRESSQLLERAEAAASAHDYGEAIELCTSALRLTPASHIEQKLALLRKESELQAIASEQLRARANMLMAHSSNLLQSDRELGLIAAKLAHDLQPTPNTRNALLRALGAGYDIRSFAAGDRLLESALSPDGSQIATAPLRGPVRLLETRRDRAAIELNGFGQALTIVYRPGSRQLVTSHVGGDIVLWDMETGMQQTHLQLAEMFEPAAASATVDILEFDRTGQHLLAAGYETHPDSPGSQPSRTLVQVWDLDTGRRLGSMRRHQHVVLRADISPDGHTVASYSPSGGTLLWNATTGDPIALAQTGGSRVHSMAFSPDSELVALACSDGKARVFAARSGQLLRTPSHSRDFPLRSVSFDSRGQRLLTAGEDGTARLWDLRLGRAGAARDAAGGTIDSQHATDESAIELRTFLGHSGQVIDAKIGPQDFYVVTAGQDRSARVFDLATGQQLMHYEIGTPLRQLQFSESGRRLLCGGTGRVVLWNLEASRGAMALRHPSYVRAACYDADGRLIITACDDETIRVWNSSDGRLVNEIRGLGHPVDTLDVDAQAQRIMVTGIDGTVTFYDLWKGHRLDLLDDLEQAPVRAARFCCDDSRILTWGRTPGATIWDAATLTRQHRIDTPLEVRTAALSPTGETLALVEVDQNDVQLWSLHDSRRFGSLGGHSAPVRSITFLPDGRLVSVSEDGSARIRTLDANGQIASEIVLQAEGPLVGVAASRDGEQILTWSATTPPTAQLWQACDGQRVLYYTNHRAPITVGAFHPDGAWTLTASKDRTVQIWPCDPRLRIDELQLRELTTDDRRRLGLLADR